jgi:hypothetical protein
VSATAAAVNNFMVVSSQRILKSRAAVPICRVPHI